MPKTHKEIKVVTQSLCGFILQLPFRWKRAPAERLQESIKEEAMPVLLRSPLQDFAGSEDRHLIHPRRMAVKSCGVDSRSFRRQGLGILRCGLE